MSRGRKKGGGREGKVCYVVMCTIAWNCFQNVIFFLKNII